jgi:hypothetical protein
MHLNTIFKSNRLSDASESFLDPIIHKVVNSNNKKRRAYKVSIHCGGWVIGSQRQELLFHLYPTAHFPSAAQTQVQ